VSEKAQTKASLKAAQTLTGKAQKKALLKAARTLTVSEMASTMASLMAPWKSMVSGKAQTKVNRVWEGIDEGIAEGGEEVFFT
jgi:hypothetical protein